ncbi:MAG TPA: choice-of-anchor D domain-containing protein [Terriglobia bacterium]|nr:choice-of-anchor D domain-containing protein [Terriglobia bacterium]
MRRVAVSDRFLALLLGTGLFVGLAQTMFSQSKTLDPGQAARSERSFAKAGAQTSAPPSAPAARSRLASQYSRLPLAFERNAGQSDARVLYLSRGLGYTLFLTSNEAALALNAPAPAATRPGGTRLEGVALSFVGANAAARVSGGDELPGKTNYFLGRASARWMTNVPNYARVTYSDVYPGVSLVFYGTQRQLEQDWVLSPGADASQIGFEVQGAKGVALGPNGDLRITLASGELRLVKPVAYQRGTGRSRAPIQASFALKGRNRVGFNLGAYDRSETLVIDPVLAYSTYLGGSGSDEAQAIALDAAGDIFVAGDTTSTDFPSTAGSFQPACTLDSNDICERDAFVTEFAAGGATEVYSTYLGGSGSELAFGLALDASGNAYITGQTSSATDFPTMNGFQTACNTAGGTTSCLDAFVSKLSSDGSELLFSTYLGGSGADSGNSIAVDASGYAFVAGQTSSADFPTTAGVIQPTCGTDGNCNAAGGIAQSDAFVAEIDTEAGSPSGPVHPHSLSVSAPALIYSTYLGGSGTDYATGIALDASDDAFVSGGSGSADLAVTAGVVQPACKLDASEVCEGEPFVAELNPTGTALSYLTYLGGSGGNGQDTAYAIALDTAGDAYVVGETSSSDFPVTAGAFQTQCGTDGLCNPVSGVGTADGFVAKLNSTATALLYSTFLGGSGLDLAWSIAVDSTGAAYVSGGTYSSDFPTSNALASGVALAGGEDAFVASLDTSGSGLMFSTFLGGTGNDVAYGLALDSSDDVFVAGSTASSDFPTLNPYQSSNFGGTDAFVAEITEAAAPFITLSTSSLAFGSVFVGTTSAAQSVIVTNTGNAALLVSSVTLGGTNPGDFSVTGDTCTGSSVAPAGTCEIDATFSPTAVGARAATITVASNASNGAQTVSLTGTGITLSVTLTPPTLTFASQGVNTTSAAQVATLTNTGTETVNITGVTLTGSDSGDFAETNTCSDTLAATASCTISVTFTPTATGTRTATLSVSDNVTGSPQTVALTGTGVALMVSLTPPVLSYPSQILNTASAVQVATLTNTGTETVNITGITLAGANAGDFADTTTCGATLAAGKSCTITVTFTPTVGGTRTATVSVADNATGSPQTVALTGQGADFSIALLYDLPNVTIPPGQTAVYELQITPLGGFTGTVSVSCSGAPQNSTCTVNPPTNRSVNGVTPVRVSIDVATTAPSFAPTARHRVPPLGPLGGRLLVLAGLGLGALAFLARKRKAVLVLAVAMFLVTIWGSCGSSAPAVAAKTGGTPTGTYTLTVTATSGSLTHTTTGTLIVN